MKPLINILLLITLMLMLGFIIMNSDSMSYTLYPEHTISVSKSVEFSNFNSKGRSNHFGQPFNNYVTNALIPSQRGIMPSINNTYPGNSNSYLSTNSLTSKGSLPIAINSKPSTTSAGRYSYGFSMNKNENNNSNTGLGSSNIAQFGGRRTSQTANQAITSGLLASESSALTGGNEGGTAIPFDPYIDYKDNDLTHPGGNPTGNPMGEPIPVGSGILPLLLFASLYVIRLMKKQ